MDPSWPQTQRQHQAMTSNWRCTPAWRSHRGGTNAWHGEETQGALIPWRNSDESSAWHTDDSWHLWDSHSGGKNGWHGEGASHSETDGSPTAVASQAPSGDSWHWRMSDDSSSSLGDPLGMARFFKPRRRETKETKDDLEAQVQGMHDCLVDLAARTPRTEEPSGSCAGAPSAPCLSSARPSSLPPRSGGRARPAKLQPVPRQDLERFARRLQGWTEKHPPFRKGWTDPRGNHICGSGHIHSPENLARAWHDGHAVPRA